jgi:hypothetical protein
VRSVTVTGGEDPSAPTSAVSSVARAAQQLEQPLGWEVQPSPARHAALGQTAGFMQASSPVQLTSHAQELGHRVPLRHESSPEQVTVQRPVPQRISPRQLSSPEQMTRHAPVGGHTTSLWQECA